MTKSRAWIRIAALMILLVAAARVAGAEPPAADLDELVKVYSDYGLPLAPPAAPLIEFRRGNRILGDGKEEPIFHLGFLLQKPTADQPAVLLVGMEKYPVRVVGELPPSVEPGAVQIEKIAPLQCNTFEVNTTLATAIQCKARGWDDLAKKLLAHSLKQDVGHRFSNFYQPANLPPRTALAHLAWAHWGNELIRPGTDRAAIAIRIRALFAAEPILDTDSGRALLRSLDAALIPSKAKPGTVEAMIDDLVELDDEQRQRGDNGPDPRCLKLSLLGFDAVPMLIAHLDDDRLTRAVKQGFNNFPTWNKRVGDVASDLLQELAGEELGQSWLDRQKGFEVEKAAARAWWEKAKAMGEEAYAVAHVLPVDPERADNTTLLRIITVRYPNRLADLYRTILDQRPSVESWPVAKAITQSAISREQKLALFLHGTENASLEHRRAALWELRMVDPERFVLLLVKTLDGLPATPAGSYWGSREGACANVVMETDDPRAWAALKRAALRADVGLRMEFLNPMDYAYIGVRQRRQRVEFLAAFLADPAVRDMASDAKRFDGPYAGFTIPRLAVRDFAAMQITSILGPETQPQPNKDWTADQWTALRAQAKVQADRELHGPTSLPSK